MKLRKVVVTASAILFFTMFTTSVGYAQWGNVFGGILQALGERYIDNNSSYSSSEKENLKNGINEISNALNTNKNAYNVTKEAYDGNYTGAIIQGTQLILNTAGNNDYDTYLNSANTINSASHEYKQNVANGMDNKEALDKRNSSIGYSVAESVIEIQDKVAQNRVNQAIKQKELNNRLLEDENDYAPYSNNVKPQEYDGFEKNNEKPRPYAETIESYNFNDYSSYNNSESIAVRINDFVRFDIEDDNSVYLVITPKEEFEGGGTHLFYQNQSDKEKVFSSYAIAKINYFADGRFIEDFISDNVSFVMQAKSADYLEWSELFPYLPNSKEIEEIRFEDVQINDKAATKTDLSKSLHQNNGNGIIDKNAKPHLLTKNNLVKYCVDNGNDIALGIDQETGRLFYNNLYNDRPICFSCNNVCIKVKYLGDEMERIFNDVCSFVMRANTYDYFEFSEVFFNISEIQAIESIKIQFTDTQIR